MKKQTTKVHRYEMKTWLQSLLFEFNPHCYNTAKCECLGLNSPGVCVKLADFGMSKGGALLHVSSGNCQGTVAYIAPERIAYNPGAHNHDFYALGDIYALGLFVWEVLYYVHHGTTVPCVEAVLPGCRDNKDILVSISKGSFNPPCDFLPDAVRVFLGKCFHFNPEERFQNIQLVMKEWEKLSGKRRTSLSANSGVSLLSTSRQSQIVLEIESHVLDGPREDAGGGHKVAAAR
jgi:serine/threonine protein kinase